jgi:hypothetical protein
MLCARCGDPISPDLADVVTNPGASGPGAVIYIHKAECRRLPQPSPDDLSALGYEPPLPPLPRRWRRS